MLSVIFAMILSLAVYYFTGSYAASIIAILAGVMIGRALSPYGTLLWLKIRPPKTHVVRQLDPDEDTRGKGMRVLVLTQDLLIDEKAEEQKRVMDNLIEVAAGYHKEKSAIFRERYALVSERSLPVQLCAGICNKRGGSVRRAYNEWKLAAGAEDFKDGVEGTDLFFTDCHYTHPEKNEELPAMVIFLFDPRMPKPEEGTAAEAVAD